MKLYQLYAPNNDSEDEEFRCVFFATLTEATRHRQRLIDRDVDGGWYVSAFYRIDRITLRDLSVATVAALLNGKALLRGKTSKYIAARTVVVPHLPEGAYEVVCPKCHGGKEKRLSRCRFCSGEGILMQTRNGGLRAVA
jgi:hypothetical protein